MDMEQLSDKLDQVVTQYCSKFGVGKSNEWFLLKIQEELGELVQVYLEMKGKSRSRNNSDQQLEQNMEEELADLVSILLAMAKYNNINMTKAIEEKWLKWL